MTIQYVLWNAEGQPDSVVQDIENMVRSYIEKVIYISTIAIVLSYDNNVNILYLFYFS